MMSAEQSRDEWLAERRKGVGASEASALFGVNDDGTWPNRFHSAHSLYLLKRGLIPEDSEIAESAEWGLRVEGVAAEWFSDLSGRKLIDHGRYHHFWHPSAHLRSTLDREQAAFDLRGPGPLEIKAPSEWVYEEWKQTGVPLSAQIQLQAQIACTGWKWGTICAQFAHKRPLWWDVDRNEGFIKALLAKVEAFWGCVERGEAPAVDSHPATERALKALHPRDAGGTIALPPEADDWTQCIEDADAAIDASEGIRKTMRNRLREALGESSYGETPNGVIWTYKANKAGVRALKRSGT